MRKPAGPDQRDSFGLLVAGPAQALAEFPGAFQGCERRTLAVDVGGYDGKVVTGSQEVERHHHPVIESPFLGVTHVHIFHNHPDQALREFGIAGNAGLADAQPFLVLDRALVAVRHTQAIGRHVVHEEIGEVLGRNHDQRVRPGRFHTSAHRVHPGVEPLALRLVGALVTSGDSGGVAANAGEYQAHVPVIAYRPERTGPCRSTPSRMA